MNEFIVFWSFDDGETLEHIGYEKLDNDGNYVFKRMNTDTKVLRDVWHLGMITDNQGNAKFYRFPHIGKTDIEGNKIYADSSIVEFNNHSLVSGRIQNKVRAYFTYNLEQLGYVIKVISIDGVFEEISETDYMIYYIDKVKNLKIIGTLQQNSDMIQ